VQDIEDMLSGSGSWTAKMVSALGTVKAQAQALQRKLEGALRALKGNDAADISVTGGIIG